MHWFVYILESELDGTLYKGFSHDYLKRLEQHNLGLSLYSSAKRPWKLRYVEKLDSKPEAIIRERQLKKQNRIFLEWLFLQDSNILNQKNKG